ncbi:serine/threonine-protein phosphatase 7 long form homolog isoform X1 [Macadamia integrifolia]|uniref:serine/threonine-protein phosphatase 7 long form homolog isoform X1 n=1 Tax=Macadamia integrifolia TaxID=60698 RepID=UPI001C4F4915|nr:serine/threonine-protein phosphatase 7 long form homolog isoform X1 [Macadamia integrifolia]XP_042515482.1 serine/threonine-protein phosphatase 7 long form homolog isoform X1 [Macadamia integrifolia]
MADQMVTLMCRWDGRITTGPQGADYEGGRLKGIRVNCRTSYSELLGRMYEITKYDRRQFNIKMTCRYPMSKGYIAYEIDDKDATEIMLELGRQQNGHGVELYLEEDQVHINNEQDDHQIIQSGLFTHMLVQDTNTQLVTECPADPEQLVPGPIDTSVLTLQGDHRSQAIWDGEDIGILKCTQRIGRLADWPLHSDLVRYVTRAGLYHLSRVNGMRMDRPLITALVERWRRETHTFHLPVGEMAITLQDTAVLLGLRVHGDPVTGRTDYTWAELCKDLLGRKPEAQYLSGSSLKMTWLYTHFHQLPEGASPMVQEQYARAYMLYLLGSTIFVDKSGDSVQLIYLPLLSDFDAAGTLSWGSAALAFLMRELCRATSRRMSEIAGCLTLLQLWAWERLRIGFPNKRDPQTPPGGASTTDNGSLGASEIAVQMPTDQMPTDVAMQSPTDVSLPVADEQSNSLADPLGCRWNVPMSHTESPKTVLRYYRSQLDHLTDDQVIWQPYAPEILAALPEICRSDQDVWRTIAPLICFDIVEWHLPQRVLRQFGLQNTIPENANIDQGLHSITRQGRPTIDWKVHHAEYITLWENRWSTIAVGTPENGSVHCNGQYMEWYRRITRRFVGHPNDTPVMRYQLRGHDQQILVRCMTNMHSRISTTLENLTPTCTCGAQSTFEELRDMIDGALQQVREGRQTEPAPVVAPATGRKYTRKRHKVEKHSK